MTFARRSLLALLVLSVVLCVSAVANAESGGIVESTMMNSSFVSGTY